MHTEDNFTVSSFRMLLSVVAIIIMLPLVDNLTDLSFYVTVSVYVLGKFIELVAKISERQLKIFYIIYICGVLLGMLAISMCFYAFASGGPSTLKYNQTLIVITIAFGFIDIADFVYCICKLSYTKNKLKQFN